MDHWTHIAAGRRTIADLLAGLDPPAFDQASLCAGWRIRDVAAHLTLAATTGPGTALMDLLRARGSFNRMVADTARNAARKPPARIVGELRAVADSRRLPPFTHRRNALLDVVVHGQDIAVPLGLVIGVDPEAGRVAADQVWSLGFPFHARRRLRGIRLTATDADWSRGTGPAVEGPIVSVLLLLTGRTAAARRSLTGPGLQAPGSMEA
jgi:uncharacterized protein (TIGR03083 family)